MQRAPANDSNSIFDCTVLPIYPASPTQHGLDAVPVAVSGDAHHAEQQQPCQPGESSSAAAGGTAGPVDVQALDAEPRRLSGNAITTSPGKTPSSSRKGKGSSDEHALAAAFSSAGTAPVAGQRIAEYEQAWTPSLRKRDTGKKPSVTSAGVSLDELPNEILTHIFSYLHPGSHDAVALVSKRMYALITTPHAWRMAFLRFFPGQEAAAAAAAVSSSSSDSPSSRVDDGWVPAPTRLFSRLTLLASWRSEYLLRTRLLRSLMSGKPGLSVGARYDGGSKKTPSRSKHATAVITYNSQLPGVVDRLHAVFTASGKKTARAVHGLSSLGVATSSKPAFGKLEAWGLRDDYLAPDAAAEGGAHPLTLYGMGDNHPTAVPNVMDVSHVFGVLVGEGVPGGHLLYRSMVAPSFQYLDAPARAERPVDWPADIPFVSASLGPSFCAIWLAKTPAVPTVTTGMISMLAGSSMGIVSAYSPGRADPNASYSSYSAYTHSVATAHWAVCPGVPIVALVADDSYTEKRRAARRVWAVAVNALGEVYCLQDTPEAPTAAVATAQLWQQPNGLAQEHLAWRAGRTATWTLVEATRRTVTADWFDSKAELLKRAASPSPVLSPASALAQMTEEERAAEVCAVEAFFRLKPSQFRAVYDVWDMRLKLEVDFAGGHVASNGADATAENIFVIACGGTLPGERKPQLVGVTRYTRVVGGDDARDWQKTVYALPGKGGKKTPEITCSAIDLSVPALVAPSEDPLLQDDASAGLGIPGQRSRWLAVGTATGSVVVWNMREATRDAAETVSPLRVIQTASPAIASVAVSSLYLVHGGRDGLVQAWDPLGSSRAAIRTLNAPTAGRIPRQLVHRRGELANVQFAAVGTIFLDPDPTVLRGVLSIGALVRHWSYSASLLHDHGRSNARKRQRRVRYANAEGQRVSRRLGDQAADYIASETAQLQQEAVQAAREEAHLLNRFGVGLAGLTDDEAVRYAEILSTEAFLDAQRRESGSGGSGSGSGGSGSGSGSNGEGPAYASVSAGSSTGSTVTPEPSPSQPGGDDSSSYPVDNDEDDFELQTQRAIRLSLMESGGEVVAEVSSSSPVQQDTEETTTSGGLSDLGFPVTYRAVRRGGRATAAAATTPPAAPVIGTSDEEDDLQLALRLSLQEEGVNLGRGSGSGSGSGSHTLAMDEHLYASLGDTVDSDAALAALLQEDEFPALQGSPAGKGKGRG